MTEPVRLLREYPYAEQLLGKPITALNLRFDMVNVKVTPVKTMVRICNVNLSHSGLNSEHST